MADPTIDSVTTFVAVISGSSVKEVLEKKFQGRRTPKSLRAARRIAAKNEQIKIPQHIMRQLWTVTGGWRKDEIHMGWRNSTVENGSKVIIIGDLRVIIDAQNPRDYSRMGLLLYRGKKVASISYKNNWPWLSPEKVTEALSALGQPYTS